MSRSGTVRRVIRGATVGVAVVALAFVGVTPASAQGLGTNDRSPDAPPAQPGEFTERAGLVQARGGAATGAAEIREALERDLGLSGAALDRLLADSATATALDAQLQGQLGGSYAGSWLDHNSGSLTVAVTDRGAASLARAAGAQARVVDRSEQDLTAITDELVARAEADPSALAGAFSWGLDPAANQVVVTVEDGTAGAVAGALAGYGDAVRIEEAAAAPQLAQQLPFLDGGIAYDSNLGGCSTGFNLRDGAGTGFFLTAGHCSGGGGGVGTQTSHAGIGIGPFVSSFFPTFDDAIVRNDNPGFWIQGPWVWVYPGFATVNGFTDAPVGTPVCKSGRTTLLTCGVITLKDEDVTFSGGQTVFDMTRHNACVEPGDSGGSNLNVAGGNFAEGVTSGAQLIGGLCLGRFGLQNVSWYFPIVDSLPFYNAVFGVNLLVG